MYLFQLYRDVDINGISGTGIVAEGVEFSNGSVVLSWSFGDYHTHESLPSISAVRHIHGHNGKTRVLWKNLS